MLWVSGGVNELRYFLADADTPTTPVSTATVTGTVTLGGVTVGSASRSMAYSAGLVVDTGKTGGYAVAFTAAEITATGQQYQATIVAVVGGVTVDTVVFQIQCVANAGGG